MEKLTLGVIVNLEHGPEKEFEKVRSFGFPTAQLACWDMNLYNPEMVARVRRASEVNSVEITTLWSGLPGPHVWNLQEGPSTIGLVPPEFRKERVGALKRASDVAKAIGAPGITTHHGFLPENPKDPLYTSLAPLLKEVALYVESNNQHFCFETGQETPVTLLRTIEDVGTENLGVNLDPANLLMYGKANPIDALDLIGSFVLGVHAKDGEYPTNGRELGKEKPLGKGRVNFPLLVKKLKEIGYSGALTIEREISGEEQIRDILLARSVLEPLL